MGVKYVGAHRETLQRVCLQEHRMNLGHLHNILNSGGRGNAEAQGDGPGSARNHDEVLLVGVVNNLGRDIRAVHSLQEPLPEPGYLMAPLEARAVNHQVDSGVILALLQGVPGALLCGGQHLEGAGCACQAALPIFQELNVIALRPHCVGNNKYHCV